jgi:hypothetical protein
VGLVQLELLELFPHAILVDDPDLHGVSGENVALPCGGEAILDQVHLTQGSGFRIEGSGFRVQGLGFRV